ncbi:helix-loop-helix DNA-binding domain-containing protein [Sodiomyces alkalinus F11]|uniref:Helix-loop-helix DNA-binding domain-containing protein n=1 Tax=Sodiomyces alkalinus (strain CBS 110278 / VKM F-3762 / F11) TaxID=1314773 RepID=A0A3N2PYU7_SODAK|nr:helix-loop-helix DNA-binding domain-containing protein [Sodiomyces alkalinus F11]ROT39703.1 helix-loop-helix DNA-binding domain-containing protein [Sodiomyces alkalinus F11]
MVSSAKKEKEKAASPPALAQQPQPYARSSSSATAENPDGTAGDEKPRLTEAEKKQNHIASEQKRRQAIREAFDRLTELVPGLEGQGRSEGLVLQRTVKYMREQLAERRALIERIEAAGGHVDEHVKR